jgi:hypothetical protein
VRSSRKPAMLFWILEVYDDDTPHLTAKSLKLLLQCF